MLSARKLHLVAGLKVHGLDLRKAELDFYLLRYNSVIGISLILVGPAYVGLIKIKIPAREGHAASHAACVSTPPPSSSVTPARLPPFFAGAP